MTFRNHEGGQTLLETIIAIGVILIGILGALVLVVANVQASRQSINRVTAANLAREGIEVVRNLRDGNWLAGKTANTNPNSWYEGIVINDSDAFPVMTVTGSVVSWSLNFNDVNFNAGAATCTRDFQTDPDTRVKIAGDERYVQGSAGTNTPYYRVLQITKPAGTLIVKSCVQWTERGTRREVVVEDQLTNWY